MPLGLICGFSPTSACWPLTGVCSCGCPGALESVLMMTGCTGGTTYWVMGKPVSTGVRDPALVGAFPSAWSSAQEGQLWWGLFLVPGREGGWHMGRERFQWRLHPLYVTQLCHLASMAVSVSCRSIPSWGLPPPIPSVCLLTDNSSLPSGTALQSSHSSSQTPVHTSWCAPCRAVAQTIYVGLTLSFLLQTGHFTLLWQPQLLPFCPN